jgi:hypothetical protein
MYGKGETGNRNIKDNASGKNNSFLLECEVFLIEDFIVVKD